MCRAIKAQVVLGGVIAHDGPLEGVGKSDALLLALDGEADVVGQGDEEGFVQRNGDLGLDIFNQILGQLQVFQRDLFHQLPLFGLALHAVGFFKQSGIDAFAGLALKAQTLAGDDHLIALVIYHAQDIVVDDFFDAQAPHPSAKKETNLEGTFLCRPQYTGTNPDEVGQAQQTL